MLSPRLTLILAIATPALMGMGTMLGSGLRKLSRQCQEQVLEFLVVPQHLWPALLDPPHLSPVYTLLHLPNSL